MIEWLSRSFTSFCQQVVVAEVLASHGQLMAHDSLQHFFQLQVEPFSGSVAVGPHLETDGELVIESLAEVKARQILVELLVELVGVLALPWDSTAAPRAWLVGEDHSAERAVGQLVLIEAAGRVRIR